MSQSHINSNQTESIASTEQEQFQVLVVDDESVMRELLTKSLERLGYHVVTAENGPMALELFEKQRYDLILLDVVMPDMDGFEVCEVIRKMSDVPVVMLTALNRPDDVVRGLELGADNYITKPFTFMEVEARIGAILRRSVRNAEQNDYAIIEHGDLTVNDEINEVRINGDYIELTRTEYQLLRYLVSHAEQPLSKQELLKEVWGYETAENPNLVEISIRRLRKKIEENPSKPKRVITVRGFGYKMGEPIQAAAGFRKNLTNGEPSDVIAASHRVPNQNTDSSQPSMEKVPSDHISSSQNIQIANSLL